MDGINRKPVKDVLVPQNDIVKRPSFAPEPRPVSPSGVGGSERIERNPFFEKGPMKRSTPKSEERPKGDRSRNLLWIGVLVVVLGVGFLVMNLFSRATIEITPSSWEASIDEKMAAVKEETGDELVFQFMSLKEEKSQEVEPTVEKKIQKKASGKVMIYNAYGKESQRLIKNTRLESPDHKIFRINDSVVVPGAKVSGGRVVEPGAVEAIVYADVPGEEYNIGLSDFTIPGFKGDPRYTKFTAKSKPDSPIDGGFSGTVRVPTDEVTREAQMKLKEELKITAIEKARGQVPAGVTFFPGSMIVKFEEVPEYLSAGDVTSVTVRAVVSVFFFDTNDLTKRLAKASLPEYRGTSLALEDMSKLTFAFLDPVDSVVLGDLSRIRFGLVGDVVFVGDVDTEKIRTALLGKEKKDFASVIVGQDNIGKADAVIRPMWNTTFPLDPQKITIKIVSGGK